MKQFIIDRYSKGQDKRPIQYVKNPEVSPYDVVFKSGEECNVYEFLFLPKWGFAQAFLNSMSENDKNIIGSNDCMKMTYLEAFIFQMAIAPDVLKYLDSFKDKTGL